LGLPRIGTARGGSAHKQDHAKETNSGGFLPPSPPEQAPERRDQAGDASAAERSAKAITVPKAKAC